MKKWLLLIIFSLFPLLGKAVPLPAQEVFHVSVKTLDPNTFQLTWTIKPGYFLYADRIKITNTAQDFLQLGTLSFPKPVKRTDQRGRTFLVYRNSVSLSVPILGEQSGEGFLEVQFQGCSDEGFCYPFENISLKVTINNKLALSEVSLEKPDLEKTKPSPLEKVSQILSNTNWFIAILSFFGFGILISFTPCILPMVPVLSGIIVGHGKISTKKAFFLSLSYVLSMSMTYALVGALIALLGSNLQMIMQNKDVLFAFSFLFVLLALSMFGFFELKLPLSWQAKLAGTSNKQHKGHYLGAAIMGCLSTLILSPCVTAPLIGVLSYIAKTDNIIFGMVTLFFLSLGMGTPLLLIGTSAGKYLPTTGVWMNTVKDFFGILFLGVAIYLLSRILPPIIIMYFWAILLVFSGIYAGALQKAFSKHEKFRQGFGILMLLYGLLLIIGASMGHENPLQPLMSAPDSQKISSNILVNDVQEIKDHLQNTEGKPVILDFYADWCVSCKDMEELMSTDAKISALLKKFKVLKVDITENNANTQAILKHYQIIAPPVFLFFTKKGLPLAEYKWVGKIKASTMFKELTTILSKESN